MPEKNHSQCNDSRHLAPLLLRDSSLFLRLFLSSKLNNVLLNIFLWTVYPPSIKLLEIPVKCLLIKLVTVVDILWGDEGRKDYFICWNKKKIEINIFFKHTVFKSIFVLYICTHTFSYLVYKENVQYCIWSQFGSCMANCK